MPESRTTTAAAAAPSATDVYALVYALGRDLAESAPSGILELLSERVSPGGRGRPGRRPGRMLPESEER